MRFKSERNAVYEKLPPLQAGDVAGKRERELNDFQAIQRYLSGLAFDRFEQDSEAILALTEEKGDPTLEAEVEVAEANLEVARAAEPSLSDDDYYLQLGAAVALLEKAQAKAKRARSALVGTLWDGCLPNGRSTFRRIRRKINVSSPILDGRRVNLHPRSM